MTTPLNAQIAPDPSESGLSESSLLSRARGGDAHALGALLERHRPRVTALCRRLVSPPPEDAEDAASKALARGARHFPTFRAEAQLSTWLCRIAVNVCRDALRERIRDHAAFPPAPPTPAGEDAAREVPDPSSGPAERAEAALFLDAVRARLDARQWKILVLSKDQGLSSAEIARLIGLTDGRVRQILLHDIRRVTDAAWEDWNRPV